MTRARPTLWWLPVVGAAATILLQILWPLTSGQQRTSLTIITVAIFAATSVLHSWIYLGFSWALGYVSITVVFAFIIEALGTNTGFPFSPYYYTDALGLRVAEVPLVIPFAWAMTAYPVLLLSRRLAAAINPRVGGRLVFAGIGAFALTAWDLFLDPQMVSAGYWTWNHNAVDLPGVPGIPAVNYLGWLGASFVLMLLLSMLPARTVSEAVPATLWAWTWIGGIIANAFFFNRPTVALVGGLAMAVVTVPYLWLLAHERRTATAADSSISEGASR